MPHHQTFAGCNHVRQRSARAHQRRDLSTHHMFGVSAAGCTAHRQSLHSETAIEPALHVVVLIAFTVTAT